MKRTHAATSRTIGTSPREITIDLITEDEAAAILGLKKATLQQRRWQKQPPAYVKIGRFVRYRMEDIAAYLDSCVVHPTVDK